MDEDSGSFYGTLIIVMSYESYVYNVGKTWENNNRPSPISPSIGGIKWYKPFPDGWFIIVFTTLLYALSLG